MTRNQQKNTMIAALALVLSLAGTGARAEVLWSSIGAAGSPDDGSLKTFDARRASLWVNNEAALPATVVARYNITPSERLSREVSLVADVFDSGDGASVSVQLYEVDLASGASAEPRLTLSSDSLKPSVSFARGGDCRATTFDFEHNAYFILVTLTRRSATAQSGVRAIQLVSTDACSE